MVKFTSYLLIASLVAAPVFASANWDDLNTRDLSEQQVFGRELSQTEIIFAREIDELFARQSNELFARDIEVEDLAERSKIGRFFKKVWGGIKKVGSLIMREDTEEFSARDELDELDARYIDDFEELSERDLEVQDLAERSKIGRFFKKVWGGIKKVGSLIMRREETEELSARDDFEELSERDLIDEEDLLERDLDADMVEREFEEDVYERELYELEEREIDELD